MRIANAKGVPGTLGAIVHAADHRGHPRRVLLTTWHTLFAGAASWQDTIWLVTDAPAPRRYHQLGRTIAGKIGNVRVGGADYFVDCAIGSCAGLFDLSGGGVSSSLPAIAGTSRARIGSPVSKVGAATGTTHGIVVDAEYTCDVQINGRLQRAVRQLLVRSAHSEQRFADDGDSGALVVDASNHAVGLVWGNTPQGDGVVCPIDPVLAALNVSFRTDAA